MNLVKLIVVGAGNPDAFHEMLANIPCGDHPIVPIMLGDGELATKMAERLLSEGVYVVGFSYPVVPKGKARIRVQISAAHSKENLDFAVQKFMTVKNELT